MHSTMTSAYQAIASFLSQAIVRFVFNVGRVRLSVVYVCVPVTSIS